MSFSLRFTLSSLLASPLVALALQAQAEQQLQPPRLIAVGAVQEAPLTATDQGTSPEDVLITQSVRQALTDNRGLSTEAQTVTVTTHNGAVTLRGQVKNAEERLAVALAAQRTAGVRRVDDQLQLDAKPQ